MSTPVEELVEATESLDLSDGLCKEWEQKDTGTDSIDRYYAALPAIHDHYQSIGVPSHLPPVDGRMRGHGISTTRPGKTAETKAQVGVEFIYISRKIEPEKPFKEVRRQWTVLLRNERTKVDEPWAIACVPLDEATALETEGWEV